MKQWKVNFLNALEVCVCAAPRAAFEESCRVCVCVCVCWASLLLFTAGESFASLLFLHTTERDTRRCVCVCVCVCVWDGTVDMRKMKGVVFLSHSCRNTRARPRFCSSLYLNMVDQVQIWRQRVIKAREYSWVSAGEL